jgi:SPP1 family predicted phage head-tail adaptor
MPRVTDRSQQFDRQIDICHRVPVTDSQGTKDYTFAVFKRGLWARKMPLPRGTVEVMDAGQQHGQYTAVFRIRYRTDIDATMRVVCLGENFDIAGPPVDVDGKHLLTELRCINGIGDGRQTP